MHPDSSGSPVARVDASTFSGALTRLSLVADPKQRTLLADARSDTLVSSADFP